MHNGAPLFPLYGPASRPSAHNKTRRCLPNARARSGPAPPPGPQMSRDLWTSSPPVPGRRERARRLRARGARQAAAPVPPQRRGLARLASKHSPNGASRRVGRGGAVPLGPPTSSLRRTQVRQPAAGESWPRSRSGRSFPRVGAAGHRCGFARNSPGAGGAAAWPAPARRGAHAPPSPAGPCGCEPQGAGLQVRAR